MQIKQHIDMRVWCINLELNGSDETHAVLLAKHLKGTVSARMKK